MPDRSEALVHWIRESTEKHQGELPVFPSVATRLVDLLEHPDANVRDAASLVSQDQVIAAQLLRTANSIVYAGAVPVASVSEALMRLGLKESANIAMAAACRSLFDVEDRAELEIFPGVWMAIWHHSLVCAYGGRLISSELRAGNPEHVFLGALLRNVGSLLVLKIVARGRVRGLLDIDPSEDELATAIRALHAPIGVNYLRSCNLPDHVIAAAADGADVSGPVASDPATLQVLRLADGLSHVIQVAPFSTGVLGTAGEESTKALGVGPEQLEYFALQLEGLAEQLRDLF